MNKLHLEPLQTGICSEMNFKARLSELKCKQIMSQLHCTKLGYIIFTNDETHL